MRLLTVAGIVSAAAAGYIFYEHYATRYPSTDDAYITANVVHIAPQVSGPVAEVAVSNQQHVTRDSKLFTLEQRPFELAVEKAKAHLAQIRQQLAVDEARVVSAKAEVKRVQVLVANAERKAHRTGKLEGAHFLPRQSADDALADYRVAQAQLAVAQARLKEARQALGAKGEKNHAVREAQAVLGQAKWELQHTKVTAPCSGRVAEMGLNPGDSVRAGKPDFVLVCDGDYWVEANFKETQLARIAPGQSADLEVDMYPGTHFKGRVESINAASGAAFSLLPPQNASGNWVKITQRVPVRIRVLRPERPLLVGTSAKASVDTGSTD